MGDTSAVFNSSIIFPGTLVVCAVPRVFTWCLVTQGTGLSWLFPFENGQPPIGWKDAVAYLVLPLLLVVSQYVSQKIVSPKTDDPQQKQTQAILQFIPLMIGKQCRTTPKAALCHRILAAAQRHTTVVAACEAQQEC